MGWTYLHKDKDMNTKDFFSKEFNFIDKRGRKVTVLDCASYLTEAYLAIESLTPGEERMVFGMVCLIHYTRNDYYNFGYKDMDESMGPYYYNCPERILKLLTPTTYQNAIKWRKKCWEGIERKKAQPPYKIGDILEFKKPLVFSGGYKVAQLRSVNKRRFIFECPEHNGTRFRIRKATLNSIPYEIVGSLRI